MLELVISELQSVMKTGKLGGDDGKWMNKGILHGSYVFNHDILPVARKTQGLHEAWRRLSARPNGEKFGYPQIPMVLCQIFAEFRHSMSTFGVR